MDSGDLFTLLVWGVIIVLTLIQSYAQQRKRREGEEGGVEGGDAGERDGLEPWAASETAGDLIPADVWKEIEGLAQGRHRGLELPEPEPPDPERREARPEPAAAKRAALETISPPPPDHPIHRSHADFGTDPSTRAARTADRASPAEPSMRGRRLFGDLSGPDLKRAVLFHEVLGPPVSKRDRRRGGR